MKKVKIINYNINIKGSNVEGKDVTLDAKENLNITASETTNKLEQDSKSSSASVGVGFDIATGQVSSVTISGSKSKGEVDANSTSYNESTVKADKNLDFTSGKDTNIKGGKLSGEKVTGNVGGDLNIESKQDKNSYEEKNSSAGFCIGMSVGDKDSANKIGIFGSVGKSDADSKYESVTDQSGIYTGKEGFDINVGENTDLKGGIISSEAENDKNKISTGTLTYEDIQNKADYKAGSIGINVDTSKNAKKKDAGVTPNIGVGAKDNAESVTKATVSEGEIEIRDKENQKQDLAGLNRDTKNSLNKLGEIFDKTKVQEKQEFAGMFQEIAHTYIGNLTGKISKEEKAFLNSFVDGLITQWTSGDFLAGASGTALLESMQSAIYEIEDPALKQIAAGALGAIAGEIVSGNAQAGASGAISTERDNHLTHEQYEKMLEALKNAKNALEATGVYGDNYVLSQKQEMQFHKEHEDDKPIGKDAYGNNIYIPENVGVDLSGNEVYLYPGPGERKFTIDKKLVATDLMKEKINSYDHTSLGAGEVYSVSQSVSYGLATVEICLTITNTGEKYQDIKILGGVDKNILEKISKLTSSSFGASYSEGTSVVYDSKNNIINDPEQIRDTLTGTSFVAGGTILSANKSVSVASNGNRVVSGSESGIGTSGIGGVIGISVGSYLGKQ